MSLETLETIAHALGVTIKGLFDERVDSHKKQAEQAISQRVSPQNRNQDCPVKKGTPRHSRGFFICACKAFLPAAP